MYLYHNYNFLYLFIAICITELLFIHQSKHKQIKLRTAKGVKALHSKGFSIVFENGTAINIEGQVLSLSYEYQIIIYTMRYDTISILLMLNFNFKSAKCQCTYSIYDLCFYTYLLLKFAFIYLFQHNRARI